MQPVLLAIDRTSVLVGKLFSWCIVLLTLAVSTEVFMRYVLGQPTEWAYDASYILYGALFMMCGPYLLSRNGHVRGDFLYRTWRPRVQAGVDLALYLLFFFPAAAALIYTGYDFAKLSWVMKEHSSFSPNGAPLYHFKSLIPIAGGLMFLQGLAEVARCVACLRAGAWPQRLHDVEELENLMLAEAAQAQGIPPGSQVRPGDGV
ncbi:MAG TPA: TRAP transporter small permease subunit [Azospirillaceae bacterium]|nr:TRAP transporter small permease subunit [Azospirillaceae bacterium]